MFNSPRLAVTSLRVFVCPCQCQPYAEVARPHYMQHTVVASPRRTTPNPMDPLFSFRFNAPIPFSVAVTARSFIFLSLTPFHFNRLLSRSFSPSPGFVRFPSSSRATTFFSYCTDRKCTSASLRYFCILASTGTPRKRIVLILTVLLFRSVTICREWGVFIS